MWLIQRRPEDRAGGVIAEDAPEKRILYKNNVLICGDLLKAPN